jgi:hypothetical protein
MRGRFGRRSNKHSKGGKKSRFGALGNMRGRFGREPKKQVQLTYGGAIGLGVAALVGIAAISVLLLLRRRSRGPGSSTEEVPEEVNTENEESAG